MLKKPRRTKILTVWLEPHEIAAVDQVTKREDSDRSKFARTAIREKLARTGFLKANAASPLQPQKASL